jgi:glutamate N-acetyltransferase/amino-acid N-acetyltransferase
VEFDPELVALWLGPHQLMAEGQPLPFDRAAASRHMHEPKVLVRLQLGDGPGQGFAWGCDLSAQYVSINAYYTS